MISGAVQQRKFMVFDVLDPVGQLVATFPYKERQTAKAMAGELTAELAKAEKDPRWTRYYVQPRIICVD